MISPDDAPPGYAGLAALVQTMQTQTPGESAPTYPVAREASLVAAMAAAVRSPLSPAPSIPRRSSLLSRLLTAKIAAAATVCAFGLGTAAAAATGSMPGSTSHASPHAAAGLATATSHHPAVPASAHGPAAISTASAPTSLPSTGPANVHAQFGPCTAFMAANAGTGTSTSSTMPPQDASTAFQALSSQHGGVAATTAYCKGVAHPGKPTSTAITAPGGATSASAAGSEAGKRATPGKPAHIGKPSDVGKPPNTGKPASAGSSSGHARFPTPNSGGTRTANTASGGASATGTATANTASGRASTAGSGKAAAHGH
jgi:hypothetical protein